MTKWDEYSYVAGRGSGSCPIDFPHEGVLAPWDASIAAFIPSGNPFRNVNLDSFTLSATWEYRSLLTTGIKAKYWTHKLVTNKLPREQQFHRLELIPLKRLMGDVVYPVDRAPYDLPMRLRKNTEKHWVVPFFSKEGDPGKAVHLSYDSKRVCSHNPPRVFIRKTFDKSQYTVDVVAGATLYYYGKYSSFSRAMESVEQLFMMAMVTPEDLPTVLREALAMKYYGRAFRECLPMHDQLELIDYFAALDILESRRLYSRSILGEDGHKMYWESPTSVVDTILESPNAVVCAYGADGYTKSRIGMKKILPFLRGKYTKALAPLFTKALAMTEEELQASAPWGFGSWADYWYRKF